ncbi:MAG: zinc-ribbon domain-containing protein [Actinobacteria bacterium]|nr:zinc-ribbon domain-containing protein [Actinomycetota bacterium]
MYCEQCGKEIPPESEFCGYCGAAVGAGASGGTPPPPTTPPAYQPQPPPPAPGTVPPAPGVALPGQPYQAYQQAAPGGPATRKSALPWILGILGVVVAAAVVLVLVFVVFKGGADTGGPEEVVKTFFKAMEKKDVNALLDIMEPDFVSRLKKALGKEYKDMLEEFLVDSYIPDDLKVDIRKMDTDIEGDRAEVTILEGTMTYTDESGDKVRLEASESDMDVIKLVKEGGKWYLSAETLEDMGLDIEDIEDYFSGYDLEDEDDYAGEDGYADHEDGRDYDDYTDYDDWSEETVVELPVDTYDEALLLVLQDPLVQEWWATVENPDCEIFEEDDSYQVRLFEWTGVDTVDFGWYAVDKQTGEVYEIVY